MPDNKQGTQPQDAARVNLSEPQEVRYWTGKFNCTELELRDAVASVGPSAKNVREFLQMAMGKKQ